MTALATLAFVGGPAVNPTTTLSLDQPGLIKVLRESFSLGAPSWDGDPVSGLGEYGERTVEMTLQITGTYPEAAAFAQQLARILAQKRRAWLMMRWAGEAAPLFALVFPSSMRELEWQNAGVGVWNLPVSLLCDHALYGPPESGSVTVNNDPAAASFPCFWNVNNSVTVKGDIETPLFVTLGPETTLAGRTFLVASSALGYGLAQSAPFVTQLPPASGWSVGSGWTTGTGDAAMSGGNYYRYTSTGSGAQASNVSSNSGQGVMAGNPIGDYRVFLRYRTNAIRDWSVTAELQDTTGSFQITGDARKPLYTLAGWLDLGVFRFPLGAPRVDPSFAASPGAANTRFFLKLSLGAGSTAGDTFDLDTLMFVPAGLDRADANNMSFSKVPDSLGSNSASLVIDGPADQEYVKTAAGTVGALEFPSFIGGLPTLVPGSDNSLTLLRTAEDGVDVLTASTSLNWTYWPRYIYMRPAAS